MVGFVPADVVRLKGCKWVEELSADQIKRVEGHLAGRLPYGYI